MSDRPGTDVQYENFLIDSGSTSHWADSLIHFSEFDYFEEVFELADKVQTITAIGSGTIQFTATTTHNKLVKFTIRGVRYSPEFLNNILSVDRLVEAGFDNPDFKHRKLTLHDYTFNLLKRHEAAQPLWRVRLVLPQQPTSAAVSTLASSSRDVTDWRWLTSEYLKYSRLTSKHPNGLSDTDCCSSNSNHQAVNVAHFTLQDPLPGPLPGWVQQLR